MQKKTAPADRYFQEAILSWYKKNRRDLPWRRSTDTRDPYHVLVSEIMLQQTQVHRVIPYYNRFLKQFPSVQSLARAKSSTVIKIWSGLGYNRRAILLQKTAQTIARQSQGKFPDTFDALVELPGIGKYTAAALLAFAFNKDAVATDTNILRIHSRYFFRGAQTAPQAKQQPGPQTKTHTEPQPEPQLGPQTKTQASGLAVIDARVNKTLPKGKARVWNNALMDFGSLVCTASSPRCSSCPVQKRCSAYAAGEQESYFRIAPPQKKFEGSRRQSRGMVLKLLQLPKKAERSFHELEKSLQKNSAYTKSIVKELEKDGLVRVQGKKVRLPSF